MDGEKTVAIVALICFLGLIAFLVIWLRAKEETQNANYHTACGEMRLVSSFTDVNKAFVVCSPEYVSSPSDFVVREVK
jgi:hypothetical protein